MRTHTNRPFRSRARAAAATRRSDRRRRLRLRELCDEVLASYRLATDCEPFTDEDRAEARAILARLDLPALR